MEGWMEGGRWRVREGARVGRGGGAGRRDQTFTLAREGRRESHTHTPSLSRPAMCTCQLCSADLRRATCVFQRPVSANSPSHRSEETVVLRNS